VRTVVRLVLAAALVVPALAGCGSSGGRTARLSWYINPDNGGQARLAATCSKASNGAYKITTSILPNDATSQREQLVRRLAAKDSSIDLMSLDPPFVAEFANAGFLRPFSAAEAAQLTNGVLQAPIKNATWNGKLYGAPFWANTQLLWYRKSVAAKAGLDLSKPGYTWNDIIQAALKTHTTVAVQGSKYEGYMVWINALVSSAGGQIITDVQAGNNAKPAIASPAGEEAAAVIRELSHSRAASPSIATDTEEQARSLFQSKEGGFMVNWPYIYGAAKAAVQTHDLKQSVVDDIGWARYPQVDRTHPSAPPFGGIELAIGNYSKHRNTYAVDAVRCITSAASQKRYMLDAGNPAARASVYDDPAVVKEFPMAALIRDSINTAAPRPITPYYADVSESVQRLWSPPTAVNASTPQRTAKFLPKVLHDKVLL
jgi:multiple sugar transport system substrate-binding protein